MAKKGYQDDLSHIRERVNLLFEQALLHSGYRRGEEGLPGTWKPAVDLFETDEAFRLCAELPGLTREEIDLTVEDRRLELSGRRDPLGGQLAYHRMERSYGPFRRAVDLSEEVDAEGITATFRRGVLEVTLPKRTAAGPRRVPVSADD